MRELLLKIKRTGIESGVYMQYIYLFQAEVQLQL